MESAEAILENENNSNVESESYIRQQQQLSLQSAGSTQDGPDGQNTSETDGGLGSSDPQADPLAPKNSHDEQKEEVSNQGLADEPREDDMDESNQGVDESVNRGVDEGNRLTEGITIDDPENEVRHAGDSEIAETALQHNSQESVSSNEVSSNDEVVAIVDASRECPAVGDENDVAMEDGYSEIIKDNDVGTSEKVFQSDEKAEDLPKVEENMQRDGEEERSSSQSHNLTVQDNDVKSPDLCQESIGGSETLLQFSPLGDNDLAPIPEKVGEDQSDSSDKGDHDKMSDHSDSPSTDEKISNDYVRSPGEAVHEEKDERDDRTFESSVEKESNSDKEVDIAAEILPISQEEENHLLDDDETSRNSNQASGKTNAEVVTERGDNKNDSQRLGSEDGAESEMEVESRIDPKSSSDLNVDKEDQAVQSKGDMVESNLKSSDVTSEENLVESAEHSLQSHIEMSESACQNEVAYVESGVTEDVEIKMSKLSPASEPAVESILEEEGMDTSQDNVRKIDEESKEGTASGLVEMQDEVSTETSQNTGSASEVVENIEKTSESSERMIRDINEDGNVKQSKIVEIAERSPGAVDDDMLEQSTLSGENVEFSSKVAETESSEKSVNVENSGDFLKEDSASEVQDSNSLQGPADFDKGLQSENSVTADVNASDVGVSNDVEMIDAHDADNTCAKDMEKETVASEVIHASDIKKEVTDTNVGNNEAPLPVDSKELKKEIINDEDDVVILDDDDDDVPVTVKKEAVEDKGKDASNSGIQIAAVSGQEYKLHSNDPGTTKDSDDKAEKSGKSKTQKCIVCQKVTKCKFNIVRGGDTKQLCDDVCFKKFRKSPTKFLSKPAVADQPHAKLHPIQPKSSAMMIVNLGDQPASISAVAPNLTSLLSTSASASLKQLQPKLQQQQQQQQQPNYKTCTVCQVINVQAPQSFCNWKGFDFCGEICLGKFQSTLRSNCSNCLSFIPNEMRASYCTKIGNSMHPFCKQMCVADFIKKLKTCVCCKQDLSNTTIVIARVGADERPKEFCSQNCVKKFQDQVEDVEIVHVEPGQGSAISTCSVCKSHANSIKHTVRFHSKTFKLCSDICLSAFQYTNKINLNKCNTCGNICTPAQSQPYFIQFEGETKRFCSDRCISTFRLDNRKLASCSWCAARKVNFDMIERQDENNKYQLFCSLNCLSLFRVNLQAKSNQAVECDRCRKIVPAQYHLTMSDASVRNFCSYACVMGFQSQFTARIAPPLPPLGGTAATTSVQQKKAAQTSTPTSPTVQQPPPSSPAAPATPASHPHGTRNKGRKASKGTIKAPQPAVSNVSTSIPVISSVVSLAPEDAPQDNVTGLQLQEKAVAELLKNLEKKGALVSGDGKQRIVVETPIPKMMKNKAVQCKPICQTKATACRPHSQTKECQTDENMGRPVIVPIPVPIYIPMPTVMYQAPAPVPVPFPIPIPVPIFVPTTRKSANGIIKTIKEIQERMPADPLEAEILMMAEAVASDKKVAGDSDSDSDMEGDTGFEAPEDDGDAKIDVPEKEGERRAEDMIQMALRMAEEMTGPMEDLETSVQPVAVNSISGQIVKPEQNIMPSTNYQQPEEDPDYMPMKAGRGRGNKRASRGRPPLNNRSKRLRTGRNYPESEVEPEHQTPPPPRVEMAPDTNYRLKFTYGVNAWKHWVVTKNTELESASKTNPRVRQLPVDVLKCTMDQLHFSLCLFIKEVRKPNGEPYSSDSIYYLCLGIQQYLYENGRIDNIFTDLYFQRFTDSLHDVLKALQPKVNSQGQMLCRIEEEHLWESKQLGAHSPYVLLNTLIYFHTKHFILKTAADHMSLSFAQILKHWKKGVPLKGNIAPPKNASLRFYCLANNKKQDASSRKGKDGGVPVYEVTENFDNPLRCPVKLYEFFLSKCPESIKNRNDIFYPVPERSCVPDSPVWYSTQSIEHHTMDKMLTRILLVREIQESHLHAQPTYIKM